MPKYIYSGLVQEDPECGYTVEFPDWKENWTAMTHGQNLNEAIYMGTDLLNLMCVVTEDNKDEFPKSNFNEITNDTRHLILFVADTDYYRKILDMCKKGRYRRRMVWKTLKKRWIPKK